MRNTNKTYHVNNQTFEPDSIAFSQSRINTKFSSNHILGKEDRLNLSAYISLQSGFAITSDSIDTSNEMKNISSGISTVVKLEQHTPKLNFNFLQSQSNSIISNIYSIDVSDQFNYSEKGNLMASIRLNILQNPTITQPQLVNSVSHNYEFSEQFSMTNNFELRASKRKEDFSVTDLFIGTDLVYTFNYKKSIKIKENKFSEWLNKKLE